MNAKWKYAISAVMLIGITGCVEREYSHRDRDEVIVQPPPPQPVYVQQPTYVEPQPVYVQPQPVYVQPAPEIIMVQPPPHEERHEFRPPPPSPRHVWVDGYYQPNGGNWVWVAGHYDIPPRPQAVWVPAHTEAIQGKYHWVPGHWQ